MCLIDANYNFLGLLFLISGQPIVDGVCERQVKWPNYDLLSVVLDIYLKILFHCSNKLFIEVYILSRTLSSNLNKNHMDCFIIVIISSFCALFSCNEVYNVWWSVVDTISDRTNHFCDFVILENIKQVSLDDLCGLIQGFNSS